MSNPILEFKDITVIKEGKKVLDSFSITIAQGENTAILGPNGAGKSSLIKTITREYYPVSCGRPFTFRILGHERWNVFDLRFLLGIVSNELQHAFTQDVKGMDVVLSGFFGSLGLYRERITPKMKKKAAQVMDLLEISGLKDRRINRMSSGEARRFLIGRALVHEPKALILDEPLNSLDMHAVDKFTGIMRKIVRSGVSLILVTQSLQDIIPEIGRVVLLKEGRIFEDGPKEEVLSRENIGRLFGTSVEIIKKKGYYYALRA